MRIVHIVFSFCTGGLETMLVDIMRLQADTDEVHMILINDAADSALLSSIDGRVQVHKLGRKPGTRNPLWLYQLNRLIGLLQPDVVHIHQGKLARLLIAGPRPVLTVHDLNIPLDSKALKCRMIAISDAVAADIRGRYGDNIDIQVIPNGIDTDAISMRGERMEPGRSLSKPVRLVQVARFEVRKKGQDILLKAVAKLVKEGRDVAVTLIGGADFDNIPELERLGAELGISNRIKIMKGLSRTELYSAMPEFDIMVHPARYEGFGLVIAEGMSAGLPLAIPDSGGPFEVADHGRLAATFPMESVDGCATAIASIIDDYDSALIRAKEARTFVEKIYSLRRMVEAYRRFYQQKVRQA